MNPSYATVTVNNNSFHSKIRTMRKLINQEAKHICMVSSQQKFIVND